MTRIFALTLLGATALTGCVIYEDSQCGSCSWDCEGEEDCSWSEDGWDTDANDDGEADYSVVLTMDPSTAQAGDSVIGSITVVEGDLPFAEVADIHVYGSADIITMDARDDELLVVLEVASDAGVGSVDFVLEMEDGGAVWFEDALYIYSGGDDGSGDGSDGSGDGSGDGTDDTDSTPCE